MKKSILIAALLIAMTGAANAVNLNPVGVGGPGTPPVPPLLPAPPAHPSFPVFPVPPGRAPSGPGTMAAPEIDPSSAMAGFTLLAGGLVVLRGRRRQ
jgi:hypothetical protein